MRPRHVRPKTPCRALLGLLAVLALSGCAAGGNPAHPPGSVIVPAQ